MAEPIDISLSILDQQSGLSFEKFIDELKTLNESFRAMTTMGSKAAVEANGNVAQAQSHGSGAGVTPYLTKVIDEIRAVREAIENGRGPAADLNVGAGGTHASSGQQAAAEHGQAPDGQPSPTASSARDTAMREALARVHDVTDYWTDPFEAQRDALSGLKDGDSRGFLGPAPTTAERLKSAADYVQGKYDDITGSDLGKKAASALSIHGQPADWLRYGIYNRVMGAWRGRGTSSGASLPYDNTIGGSSPFAGLPGLGFQIPGSQLFTQQGQERFTEGFKRFRMGLSPGFSRKEAGQAMDDLYSRGWYGGEHRDQMLNSVRDAVQRTPALGQPENMSQYVSMMDQATRLGAMSVGDFTKAMQGVNDVARKAGLNLNQFMQAMDEVAQGQEELGATYGQGLNFAKTATSITGWDPRLVSQLQQNPFVQGMAMSHYGLLPNQMGLLSPEAQLGNQYSAIDMMMKTLSGFGDQSYTDEFGHKHTTSGRDQQIAAVAGQMGMKPQQLKDFLRNEATIKGDTSAKQGAWDIHNDMLTALGVKGGDVRAALHHDSPQQIAQAKSLLTSDTNRYASWMSQQHDASGKRVYTDKDIENIRKAGQVKGNDVVAAGKRMEQEAQKITEAHVAARRGTDNRKTVLGTIEVKLKGAAQKLLDVNPAIQIAKTARDIGEGHFLDAIENAPKMIPGVALTEDVAGGAVHAAESVFKKIL